MIYELCLSFLYKTKSIIDFSSIIFLTYLRIENLLSLFWLSLVRLCTYKGKLNLEVFTSFFCLFSRKLVGIIYIAGIAVTAFVHHIKRCPESLRFLRSIVPQ
jgi:hypothetical protein